MKIAIVKNNYELTVKAVEEIKLLLKKDHIFTTSNPDVVISVGGDGTFLRAVKEYNNINKSVIFFAVHSGTLGFYSDYTCKEIKKFVKAFVGRDFDIEEADLLNIRVGTKSFNALNDFRIESLNKTAIMDVFVNDKLLEKFRGNGLCFSTPSGSTAYNKSLGGAILWPSFSGFQMTEVASISNNAYSSLGSSIVFSKDDIVTLVGKFHSAFVGIDTELIEIKGQKKIQVSLASSKVKIARFSKHYDFHDRLRDGFIK